MSEGKKVLIVDDSLFMRKHIRDVIERAGHKVCGEAGTAYEAVQKYKELKPDLVTLDIIMPKVEEFDGVDAMKEILRFDSNAAVIIVSAVGAKNLVDDVLSSGAKGFLVKPFDSNEFLKLVHELFNKE